LGSAYLSLGSFNDAIDAFEKCVASCGHLPVEAGLHEHGESPRIIGTVSLGLTYTLIGNFERGQTCIEDALAAVRRVRYPIALAFTFHIAAFTQYFLEEAEECLRYSRETLRVSEEHRLVFWLAGCDITGGWAEVRLSGNTTGIDRVRRGLHAWQSNGAELHIPTWQSFEADCLLALGANDETDEIVTRALDTTSKRAVCNTGTANPEGRCGGSSWRFPRSRDVLQRGDCNCPATGRPSLRGARRHPFSADDG
jgi:hypothetical protein